MSRFTEHFDIDASQLIYAQTLSSPSKASFLSMSSSESSSAAQPKAIMEPILTHSYSSFESNSTMPSSPTSFEREEASDKPLSTKLKRFLTTMSKKKRSISNHSQ